MVSRLLVRGMLVGVVAGLLCFVFLKTFGEPQVDRAIAFETQLDEAKAAAHKAMGMDMSKEEQPELVSREMQAGLGLFTGVLVYSTAFGGLFALAFACAYGRAPEAATPRALSALLAVIGFVAIYLIPNLKYPANPPSVGEPDTIGIRTALYLTMIAVSIAGMIASVSLKRFVSGSWGAWNGTLAAVGTYLVLMVLAGLLLPSINEVPDQFPAVVLWNFRLASVGAQLIMWAALGVLFGALTQRASARGALVG